MNFLTYNISLATGLICLTVGATLQWGIGIGLLTAGVTTISLTIVSAMLTRGR
ncbi:hypothetical protein ACO0K9_00990 [Undibacterium sp. Ji50W]|uniref:hypothetical protein n=1 Tax=Undibacterium sp. Ji50W TaxID=3413041 RepID=UPI003BF14F1A